MISSSLCDVPWKGSDSQSGVVLTWCNSCRCFVSNRKTGFLTTWLI